MKKKKNSKIIIVTVLSVLIISLICIFAYKLYDYCNYIYKTYDCIISSIDDNDITVIEYKWIKNKIIADEINIVDYYKNYFSYPTSYKIEKDITPTIEYDGKKISWNELKIGDELIITEKIPKSKIYDAILGIKYLEEVQSAKLVNIMASRVFNYID